MGHAQDMKPGATEAAERYKKYVVELCQKVLNLKLKDRKESKVRESRREHSLNISVFLCLKVRKFNPHNNPLMKSLIFISTTVRTAALRG